MKAPVADAAGKDASPSGTARDTDAPIIVQTVTRGRCRRVRPIISCRFAADTVSDGRIAICYCLLRFANRAAMKPNRDESGAGACSRTWPPKPLAARRTRARDQDDRREARLVSVRMLRPERGFDVGTDRKAFESRFATVCAGLQMGQRRHRQGPTQASGSPE